MAKNFPTGFNITSSDPIDTRLTMSKAEMLAAKKPTMPPVYLTVCTDDGNIYLYNANNTVDPETGRFRLFKSQGISDSIGETLVSPDEDNVLQVMEDGTLKVTDPEHISTDQILSLFQKESE